MQYWGCRCLSASFENCVHEGRNCLQIWVYVFLLIISVCNIFFHLLIVPVPSWEGNVSGFEVKNETVWCVFFFFNTDVITWIWGLYCKRGLTHMTIVSRKRALKLATGYAWKEGHTMLLLYIKIKVSKSSVLSPYFHFCLSKMKQQKKANYTNIY